MLPFAPILLAVVVSQEPKKAAELQEEVTVLGLPTGEPARLPERVTWDLAKAVTAKTATRQRINLEGLWRFAAVPDREAPVVRAEMGWVEMPGHWASPGSRVYDARFRVADGVWRGKPLEEFPWGWVERDITISNAVTLKWLGRRVFLVVRGHWARAEVYASQRISHAGAKQPDGAAPDEAHVHVEPISGTERDGEHRFELTEALMYPGTTQLSLRLRAASTESESDVPAKTGPVPLRAPASATRRDAEQASALAPPYIGLELVPSGPRVEAIRLRRDPERAELVVTVDLMRPTGFPVTGKAPIRTIPLSLKLRLDDVETGATFQKLEEDIGPMPKHTQTVTLRLPWSAKKTDSPPSQARMFLQLAPLAGGLFDAPFPVEFRPVELQAVDEEGPTE